MLDIELDLRIDSKSGANYKGARRVVLDRQPTYQLHGNAE